MTEPYKVSRAEWLGGQIEVTITPGGFGIEHRREDGRVFGLGWNQYRKAAIAEAKIHAESRKAKKLLVEEPLL